MNDDYKTKMMELAGYEAEEYGGSPSLINSVKEMYLSCLRVINMNGKSPNELITEMISMGFRGGRVCIDKSAKAMISFLENIYPYCQIITMDEQQSEIVFENAM